MKLLAFIKQHNPEILEVYRRTVTPFYYEAGVLYHPIRAGFGCMGESKKPLEIEKATYYKDDIQLSLISRDGKNERFSVSIKDASTSIKRLDESIQPKGNIIPDTKEHIFMTHNGIEYTITKWLMRNYTNKRLDCRIFVRRSCDEKTRFGQPYYNLYSVIGQSSLVLQHVKSWDGIGRENYDIKFNVSMRDFKAKVFGDPNIKIKSELFTDIPKFIPFISI